MKPSYLIIGGVKCASSSLYRYLNEHPQVLPCKTKEPGYLNLKNPLKLLMGYKSYINLFPNLEEDIVEADWLEIGKELKMEASTFSKKIIKGQNYITGEATANIFVNANPRLVKFMFPKVKIILSLRNPTERFLSHFKMFKRFEREGKKGHVHGKLEDFIAKEIEAYNHKKRNEILKQGVYIDYLPKWKKTFGDNLLIIQSNDLQGGDIAIQTLNKVTTFLGLDRFNFTNAISKKHNVSPPSNVEESIREKLNAFYLPYNQQLLTQYKISV